MYTDIAVERGSMARYIQDVTLNKPDDFVYFIMNDYLQKNGFIMSDWKGEPAYRAGDPMLEGYKYLKWSYANGIFHLEAWLKGTFGGEWNLNGFVGCMMKKPYKSNLEQLITVLQQSIPQPINASPDAASSGYPEGSSDNVGQAVSGQRISGQTASQQIPQGQPFQNQAPTIIPVQTVDNSGAANQALIFGIVALVLCWSPILCIIFACLGFSRGRMGAGSSKAGQAKAGKICSIVALCITGVLFLLNLVLTVMVSVM